MSYPFNRSRSEGVSYRPWAQRVIELCEGEDISPPETLELSRLYNDNFTYEEAMLFSRFKTASTVFMELHVRDNKGHYSTSFHNSIAAKEFFQKFPRLRKMLDQF